MLLRRFRHSPLRSDLRFQGRFIVQDAAVDGLEAQGGLVETVIIQTSHHLPALPGFSWKGGELQKMVGRTDDNGEIHEVALLRTAREYEVEYNGQHLTLPHGAFPTSPWHYKITENTLLFNIVNFELLKVEVSESPDTVTIGSESIPATKFEFTGGWKARLWFDESRFFLKGEYDVAGRQVTVVVDP